jgi:hypothetical protein
MKIFKLFFISLLVTISLLTVTNSAAPSWWYLPWGTLDPICSPWDTNCFVKNTSVTWNTTITWATKTKITYDSKWLVTSGSTLIESDIPSLSLSKITSLITSLASKLNISDIIDNLTSTDTNKPLSANQGKILKDLVDTKVNSWSLSTVATTWKYTDLLNKPDLSVYDEVEQYSNSAWFPWTWNTAKFYLAQDTWLMYRWTGSSYSIISWKLALWETSSTAYRWDYGKALKDKQDTQQTDIDLNTAKVTNATHTGDVTGDTALTIQDNKITTAKIADTNVTKAKLNSDVFNNTLTSDATDEALTAKQGKELKTLVDAKVTWNTTITWATKTKITYDSKWLVTSGSTLIESDIPSLSLSKITSLITSLASKLNISDIIDNLTSTDTNKPLSANQGKILKDLVDTKVNSWSLSTVATTWKYTDLLNKPDLSVYDEVEQYSNSAWFPWTWNTAKFYLAQDTWLMYRWTGSSYSIISWKLALWETSSTAYRWDYGKALKDKQDTQQTDIDLNTAKVTNATHTGDVTGDTALAIGDDKITTSKIANTNVTKAKLNSDVFNNTLTSDATDEALTAKQGKELKTLVDEKVKKVTSTDNAIVRFDGTTGEVQNSDVPLKTMGISG